MDRLGRTTGVALASVALLATAACGGSGDSKASDKASKSASSSPSASASTSVSASPSALPTYSDATTGADRPTVAVLSQALQKGTAGSAQAYTKPQADCVAKALHDSPVSNVALTAISKLDQSFQASAKDNAALEKTASALSACQTAK